MAYAQKLFQSKWEEADFADGWQEVNDGCSQVKAGIGFIKFNEVHSTASGRFDTMKWHGVEEIPGIVQVSCGFLQVLHLSRALIPATKLISEVQPVTAASNRHAL